MGELPKFSTCLVPNELVLLKLNKHMKHSASFLFDFLNCAQISLHKQIAEALRFFVFPHPHITNVQVFIDKLLLKKHFFEEYDAAQREK